MITAGQIILFPFPTPNQAAGKFRPALVLGKPPGLFDDWLICMISSQLRYYVAGFDEIVADKDSDFSSSGMKVPSLIRLGRLAVIQGTNLAGAIGQIAPDRLARLKSNLADWLRK